jgi:hypothetical protein
VRKMRAGGLTGRNGAKRLASLSETSARCEIFWKNSRFSFDSCRSRVL